MAFSWQQMDRQVGDVRSTPFQLSIQCDSQHSTPFDIEQLFSSSNFSPSYDNNFDGPTQVQLQFPQPKETKNSKKLRYGSSSTNVPDTDCDNSVKQHAVDRENLGHDKESQHQKDTSAPRRTIDTKRKIYAMDDKGPRERRRKQVREAQRAYRLRKASETAYLEGRVKQLESDVENMSSAVLSISEELIDSNILSCQSGLTTRLRGTIATCLAILQRSP